MGRGERELSVLVALARIKKEYSGKKIRIFDIECIVKWFVKN